MISAILVDDEILTVEALKKIINGSNFDVEIVGEANNGVQALKIIQKIQPDLAFVDIRMPEMDGLQLIKILKDRNIKTKIIILSAFRDFEYARQAMEYGACGYLVKPIDKIKLFEEIKQIKQIIQEEKNVLQLKGIVNESIPLVKERYLKHLFTTNANDINISEQDRALLDIDELECQLMLISLSGTNSNDGHNSLDLSIEKQIINYIEKLFTVKTKTLAFFLKQHEIAVIFNTKEDLNISDTALMLLNFLKQLIHMDINIGISSSGISLSNISSAYNEARIALIYRFYLGLNSIIFFNQVKELEFSSNFIGFENEDYLIEQIKMGISDEAIRIFDQMYDSLRKNMNMNPEMVYIAFYKMLLFLDKALKDATLDNELRMILSQLELEDLKQYQTMEQLSDFLKQTILKITFLIENGRKSEDSRLIEKVKHFCEENYSNDITLDMISVHVCMARNYFCSLFKKKTGESFWDYITYLRIRKAKEYLETSEMKIGNISEKVGYKNLSHFCRLFKEVVGVSPSDYKQKFLEKLDKF